MTCENGETKKQINKKYLMATIIPLVVLTIALVALIVSLVPKTNNIFSSDKVAKINLGDSQEQVVKILGNPYDKSDYKYEYYSEDYKNLRSKGKTKELEKLTYKYICIGFNFDGEVTSVLLDTKKREKDGGNKSVKSYEVKGNTTLKQYATLNLYYNVKYSDGSYLKEKALSQFCLDLDMERVEWKDDYGNDYSAKVKFTPISKLTSDIVEWVAGGNKSTLTQFEIATNISQIDEDAFEGCDNLTTLTTPAPWLALSNIPKANLNKVVISCGEEISNKSFMGCKNLTSVELPSTIKKIGEYAFYGCDNLANIELPDGIEIIDNDAFLGCNSFTNIEIPDSVTSIGEDAFGYCLSLKSINIPDSVTSLGDAAFEICRSLESIELPSSITSIGRATFYGCSSLTSVKLPETIVSIGDGAFTYCESLTNIKLPSSVTSIGYEAFDSCSNLKSIEIPNGVTSIGKNTFYKCISLTSVVIPSSVTSIGNYAFQYCSGLSSIEIPKEVTSMGNRVFSYCDNLTIYCEVASQPSEWSSNWNDSNREVVWEHSIGNK